MLPTHRGIGHQGKHAGLANGGEDPVDGVHLDGRLQDMLDLLEGDALKDELARAEAVTEQDQRMGKDVRKSDPATTR